MKRVICFLLALLLLVCLTACGEPDNGSDTPKPGVSTQFIVVESAGNWDVVYDSHTGVMYTISRGGYNQGTFTLLVNADGTPRVYSGFDMGAIYESLNER